MIVYCKEANMSAWLEYLPALHQRVVDNAQLLHASSIMDQPEKGPLNLLASVLESMKFLKLEINFFARAMSGLFAL